MKKIAVIGQQCSGKSSAANFIKAQFEYPVLLKFAQPIYDTIGALNRPKHRAFMQQFGDLAKLHFGDLIFTNIFKERVKEIENGDVTDLIICDDMRFGHEIEACREAGFKIMSINATRAVRQQRSEAQGFAFIENHASEVEVPSLIQQADYIVYDDGISMDDLKAQCDRFLSSVYG